MRLASIFLPLLAASPVPAQVAFPCDWQAGVDAIVEPWEDNSATFSNGVIRVALLDMIEPAAAAAFLLILHPPFDEVGGRACTIVGVDKGLGCGTIQFNELSADYTPETGLVLNVPAVIYLPEQSFRNIALLSITVNQSTGNVAIEQELGHE